MNCVSHRHVFVFFDLQELKELCNEMHSSSVWECTEVIATGDGLRINDIDIILFFSWTMLLCSLAWACI